MRTIGGVSLVREQLHLVATGALSVAYHRCARAVAIVLVVLAVFCVIGWVNYRRIAHDGRSPFAPSRDGDGSW
jgi:TRAP-type C4-dicarboxylate transport system permease small subunit